VVNSCPWTAYDHPSDTSYAGNEKATAPAYYVIT